MNKFIIKPDNIEKYLNQNEEGLEGIDNYLSSFTERFVTEVVKFEDEVTKDAIKRYFFNKYPKENLRFNFLDKEIVDEIIDLGIVEYMRRHYNGEK